jgi:hypothetical protein
MIEGAPPRREGIGQHPGWRPTSRLGWLSVYRTEKVLCIRMIYVRRSV